MVAASMRPPMHNALVLSEYRNKYIAEIWILRPTFLQQKVSMYLQPLLRNAPESYRIR